ncbi:SCP2 sterol-binding domain-containing protein [Phenylobacterium sp.]|uniref:ubiquinone anaerobic biosynthesis accessory factor UbiT n=1 Tax=Phenylobacterium sp. TaxID=1871053 RepID=UPI00273034D1|nr:SCP2 sterol-binding domain-containing protein [Phenylobacterium sp.]MDP2212817.1 SCP2 sterol-binding domain-containing protein [Phenylobacterium sp.]
MQFSEERLSARILTDLTLALRPPVEMLLNLAVKRAWRRSASAFGRLGRFQNQPYLIDPEDLPVAFELTLSEVGGAVKVVRRTLQPTSYVAEISGELLELLALFDGSADADAAFFAGGLTVRGDTGAVLALNNALEAANLRLADLLVPAALAPGLDPILQRLVEGRRAHKRTGGQPYGVH